VKAGGKVLIVKVCILHSHRCVHGLPPPPPSHIQSRLLANESEAVLQAAEAEHSLEVEVWNHTLLQDLHEVKSQEQVVSFSMPRLLCF